jgi:hypothetical protein
MRAQSASCAAAAATQTITRAVTVAAGVFAPGHLGELTQVIPFELADSVLAEARATQRRLRDLPSRVGVYFVPAACRARPARRCGICAAVSARRR